MEPTPEQVEAVARAIDNEMPGHGYGERAARAAIAAINAEPPTKLRNILGDIRGMCTDEADYRAIDWQVCRALDLLAEPLTSTPEPSTTETGPEGADMHSSVPTTDVENLPPGFEWEYRAVWPDVWPHLGDVWVSGHWGDHERDQQNHAYSLLERRLVGPAERVQE